MVEAVALLAESACAAYNERSCALEKVSTGRAARWSRAWTSDGAVDKAATVKTESVERLFFLKGWIRQPVQKPRPSILDDRVRALP